MLEVRWHGRGGQGGFTAARLLGLSAALFEDRHALAFPSFGPERRGAPVLGFTRIDDRKITDRSSVTACDFLVVLDETLVGPAVMAGLRPHGKLILNTADPRPYSAQAEGREIVALDASALAQELLGRPIANTAMLGALIAATGIVRLESAVRAIHQDMPSRIAGKNAALLERAFQRVSEARS